MSLEFKPSFQSFDLSGSVSDFAIDEHFQCGPWNNILYLTAMRRVRKNEEKSKSPHFFHPGFMLYVIYHNCLFVAVVRIAILKHRPGSIDLYIFTNLLTLFMFCLIRHREFEHIRVTTLQPLMYAKIS